jgi:hypothetical protein
MYKVGQILTLKSDSRLFIIRGITNYNFIDKGKETKITLQCLDSSNTFVCSFSLEQMNIFLNESELRKEKLKKLQNYDL